MANYHHMLKRKGQAEYEPAGYINIPLWREGDQRRVTVGDDRLSVRIVERMDRERVIYTEEIDPLRLVEWPGEKRPTDALEKELIMGADAALVAAPSAEIAGCP